MTSEPVRDAIQIQGVGDIRELVDSLDFSQMLKDYRYDIAEEKDAMFTNQSTVFGQSWEPLAESTILRKGYNVALVDTGDLRRSLVDVGGEKNVSLVGSHSLIYGTDVEYAIFHVTGTDRMPARDITGVSEESVDNLAERIAGVTSKALGDELAESIDPTSIIRFG